MMHVSDARDALPMKKPSFYFANSII